MAWPPHFPEGCPPADSQDPDGVFFRFLQGDAVTLTDLMSHHERAILFSAQVTCNSCGLSMLPSQDDVARFRRKYPSLRTKQVASIDLAGKPGKLRCTPSKASATHHTWWLTAEADRELLLESLTLVVDANG